jgi:dihydroorotate dehydrogenase electron transfer subunit
VKQLEAAITSAQEVTGATRLLWLEAPEMAQAVRPGQFVMVRCGPDNFLPRPFSVHRVDGERLALLFSVVGGGTRWLAARKKGEKINIFGPLGNGFTIRPGSRNLLLVAGGIGLAPLAFLADTAIASGKKVTLITGARDADCLPPVFSPQSLYDKGALPASLQGVTATEDGSEGFKGLATQLIPAYLEGSDQVFACGPVAMYRAMAKMPELKDKSVQVSLEMVMGCGTGVCYGCTIKTKSGLRQVCKDGPVFEMGELEGLDWDALGRE